jgi:hypothetical protein
MCAGEFRQLFHGAGKPFVGPDEIVDYLRNIGLLSFCNLANEGKVVGVQIDRKVELSIFPEKLASFSF